ncbi:MAG TPA: septum formation initiator family protein [Candidatus Saccharibacteria bacterium]|nr:septum formation initiator family protein [Candidatus Saccharibacteria bacterium]
MKPKKPKTQLLHRIASQYRHLLTIQNAGLAVALLVALSWIWGAVVTLQKNYQHQQQVDANNQRIAVTKLQNQNLQFQQAYLKSDEFLELSARQKLGLAQPGEHLVMLPSSEGITDKVATDQPATMPDEQDNFTRWLQFFFGD